MKTITFKQNVAPYHAGETAGLPDAVADRHVRHGHATFAPSQQQPARPGQQQPAAPSQQRPAEPSRRR